MPKMPPRPCTQARCNNMATKSGRCDDHQHEAWSSNKGKSAESRGYGYQWKKLREKVLIRDGYLCQKCLASDIITLATDVDHIVNKKRGGSDQMSNLESLCNPCHKEKTKKERLHGRHQNSPSDTASVDKY